MIKRFAEFHKTQNDRKMFENENVAVVDMRDEAKHHIQEADEKLQMAADAVYELKRMADYVKIDFPQLSQALGSHAETILGDIEKIQKDVKNTMGIIK
jgi:hypothetical protein